MDADTFLAYYLFVNFGVLPDVIAGKNERVRALAYAMAEKDIHLRQKEREGF